MRRRDENILCVRHSRGPDAEILGMVPGFDTEEWTLAAARRAPDPRDRRDPGEQRRDAGRLRKLSEDI